MSNDLDYFPRGASTAQDETKSEKSRINRVDRDDLFVGTSSKRKRSNYDSQKLKVEQNKKKKKSIDGEDRQETSYRRLHKQNLTDGVLMCGCIEKISPYELRVSLPHQSIGYIPITMISDEYTKLMQKKMSSMSTSNEDDLDNLFHIGQYVICRVIQNEPANENDKPNQKKRLHLSINPKDVCDQIAPDNLVKGMILPGVVSSIADHGFIIDIGFSHRQGFLLNDKRLNTEPLKVGFHGLFQIKETSSTNSRIIPLKMLDNKKTRSAMPPTKLPFHMLLPGLKCKTRVNGLEVSFGEVKGFIHLQDLETLKTPIEDFSSEQELEAIIVSIDPTTKLIHFSMQTHLLSLNTPPPILEINNNDQTTAVVGSIQNCVVIRNIGSSIAIRIPSLSQYGTISAVHLTDDKYDDLQQVLDSFKPGQKLQCRIIGISLASNLAICTFKKSIMEAPFINYSNIEIGSLVKGSINHVDQHGLIINLTKYVNGFVPIIHNADIPIKEALNKFALKKQVQCRVLQVDPSRQRLILTMKKSLINTKIPIVYSYNDLQANLITIGVIISIQDYGLLVKLFGDLCGLVPKTEIGQLQTLGNTNIKSQLQQMFYVGQTVSCKVMNFDEEHKKITLSLKVPGKMTFGSKLAPVPADFSIGKVIQWTVTECESNEHLIANVITERRRKPITVTLTRNHTSDFVEHQSLLMHLDLSSKKDQQRDGIYWSHLSYINISMRKILIEFCRRSTLPQKFDDCIVGSIVPGVIQNIFEYGLFIDLPNSIIAFAPHKHLDLHGSLESIEKKYRIGQTVFVRILQLDEGKQRCIVSLKSLMYDGEIAELNQTDYVLKCYLDEKYQLIQDMTQNGTGPLSKFFQETKTWIGFKCRCVIEKRVDDWFVGRLENGLPATLPYDAHYSIGDSIEGYIIDFNLPAQQFIITMDLKKPIKYSTNSSQTFTQCTILCQLPSYALAITQDSNQLVHLPTFSDLNSFYSISSTASYKRTQQIDITPIKPYRSEEFHYFIVPFQQKKSSIQNYQSNETVPVTIIDVLPKQLNVKLNDGSRGRIHITELFDNPSTENLQKLNDLYHANETLNARIIGTRNIEADSKHKKPVYELSLREKPCEPFEIGDRIIGFFDKVDEKTRGSWFYLSLHLRGYVPPEFISKQLTTGQCSDLTIMNKIVNDKGEHYTLSMFDNNQSDSNIVFAQFKELKSANEFHFNITKDDENYQGILVATDVSDVFENFVFWNYLMNVKPPVLINGQLHMKKELWKFKNKTIRAFVKEENKETKQMILSTRKSKLEKNHLDLIDDEIENMEQISIGDILHGYIDVLTNRQITLLLGSGKTIMGHVDKVFNRTLGGHLREYLDVGMVVEAVVLNIDKEKKKCQMKLTDQCIQQIVSKRSKTNRLSRASSLNGSIAGDDDHDIDNQELHAKLLKTDDESKKSNTLGNDLKFDWDDDLSALRPSTDDNDIEQMDDSISSIRKIKNDSHVSSSNNQQRTQEEYEALVRQAPNDSQLWIEYMQFYIDQAEIDRARALAERALVSIFYREERDKLNIWIAYMGLENRYGTPEKVNAILTRALGNCDGANVYQRLACDVYEKNEQYEDANATFGLLIKKFNKNKQAWLEYIMYLFRRHQTEQAKTILDKSFASLSSTDHVEMINKFGQLEFKYGDKERAKTVYEKLLASYPKRTDLWSIYIDMLIKYDADPLIVARSIFDRVLSLNIPPKKMKFLIKKYLQFEKQHGTTADVNRAKERITQYVNTNDNNNDTTNSNMETDELDF
ncbi:unnamed protein product [Rotaria socialis]|uniref:S1 motif domain-containing protein n=1 Tax=Rotaria socialis TaxID=392032 RepID=A0A820H3M8_9BILA|nr:unnamed protein product [Rotaria socialis]CAF4289634.1 unnamed protein product [Rotaria socialis]